MATTDKMEKYLNKKKKYKPVETMDKVYARSLKNSKMLIRDSEGNVIFKGVVVANESEDGVMAYTTAHPHGGHGRRGYNKGLKCPHCGKNIDLGGEGEE